MSVLKIKYEWLAKLLPEGFPYPSSTLISGLGGTGKPLVEFAFVAAWLEAGGSVIGIPLQYPTAEFVGTSMNKLYNINLNNYRGKIAFIQFVIRRPPRSTQSRSSAASDVYKRQTYIFSVSTSAFADEIKIWEEAADNLMFTRIEKPMRLFFRVSKMKGVRFSKEELEVPVSKETLEEIREVAETTRRRTIPQIMNI